MAMDVKAVARKLPLKQMTSDQILNVVQYLITEVSARAYGNGYRGYAEALEDVNDELFSIMDSVNIDEPHVDLDKEKWDNYYRDNPVD